MRDEELVISYWEPCGISRIEAQNQSIARELRGGSGLLSLFFLWREVKA